MITIVPFLKNVSKVIINPALQVLFAIATLYFIYAVIKLVSSNGTDKASARDTVMWSLIGMFIMISVYGIINFVIATFDLPSNSGTNYLNGKL